jgi:hypothetical protein
MLWAMTLPTDPASIAELERLIAECEHKRQAWLEAAERLYAWMDCPRLPGRIVVSLKPKEDRRRES